MQISAKPISKTTQLAIAFAAVAIGVALKIAGGNFHPISIALLLLAVLAVLHAAAGKPFVLLERLSSRAIVVLTVVAAVLSLAVMLIPPLVPPSNTDVMYRLLDACGIAPPVATPISPMPAVGLLIFCGVAGGCAALLPLKIGRWLMPLALVLHLASLFAAIAAAPTPVMDVIVFQSAAPAELMAGRNPYAMTFPDLSGGTSPFYGPGLQADGQLLFGFPYPPLSLFWLIPAYLAGAVIQSMHAIAFTGAAALIAYTSRSPTCKAAALLFMLMPIGPLVICNGWTEPLVAFMLALTVFLACRKPQWTGGGLGLFWAAKQYVPLLAPLSLLLIDRVEWKQKWLRMIGVAIAVGAIVTLPLALWDFPAFWHSAVAVQLRQPFRSDALSFLAAANHWFDVTPPAWIAFIALAAVQALCLWKCPRSPAGFAIATAASLLVFFAFNKQAFANYYFLVVAACCCALAASDETKTESGAAVQVIAAKRRHKGSPGR
jgi:hypothetical protein